jgi:rubrerythrin
MYSEERITLANKLLVEKGGHDQAQATEKFTCPYCGYECDMDELGGEWDCPLCGDN